MKSIHIFVRQHRGINSRGTQVRGQWRLHQDAVDARVAVEFAEHCEKLRLRCRIGQYLSLGKNAQPRAHPFLHPDIDFRRRVFAHPHEGQSWLDSLLLQRTDALGGFQVDFFGQRAPVNEVGKRH